ncbi:MAG: hydroxymethylglutaryl-CoA lyase [Candidatus Eremiobacteraeota bacterium]|nr:hydroxymethylglutaryl-CoA lyase [Candidatus Eremiobacteraeota bacterium]
MLHSLPARVTIVEVGPRDGLQNERAIIPTALKIQFIDALSAAGLPVIEATSFVSPASIPQLSDADDVLRGIRRTPGVRYPVLVPNERGLERALAAGAEEIALFTAASETFNRRNINATIAESLQRFRPVVATVKARALRVRGYISTGFGCPYEGPVAPEAVARVAVQLLELGVDELSIGDTIGVATPNDILALCDRLLKVTDVGRIALHLHDTRGTALANILAGLQAGIAIFDASAGGLGGCPFAPGAAGNVATEDLLYLLDGMGIQTGVSLAGVVQATSLLAAQLQHPMPSKYYQSVAGRTV